MEQQSVFNERFEFGDFVLDGSHMSLKRTGREIALRPKSFDLLVYLVSHPDRLVSKDELMSALWPKVVVTEDSLTRCISEVREALGDREQAAIRTVPKRGYRFALPVVRQAIASAPATAPAAAAPAVVRHNLPQPRTHFVGRASALTDCARLLDDVRLLTLTGIGGCGKTRLALQLAQQALTHFADGVWFVDLAPVTDGQRVAASVAAALDIREEAGTPTLERLKLQLAQRRLLVVLDNCEHLIDATADVADALLAACVGLKIVATSRERLRVVGEQIFPVEQLSLPESTEHGAMQASEAVQLFIDRASAALPGFAIDAHNAAAIGEICRRLDGIALAIELAAARVRMLSVAEINARLDDRLRFLTSGSRVVERHQTLQATLQWSYDSLAEPEQRLFRELAVFAGGCSLDAVADVCEGADEAHVLDLLTLLHDKSLLTVDRHGGTMPARYRMLETVRQYAQVRFDAADEASRRTRERHLRYYVALAESASQLMQGPRQGEAMQQLRLEQDNLLAAHGWSAQAAGLEEAGLKLAGSLARYWLNSAQLELGFVLAQAALARAGEGANALWRCRALAALGTIAFRMGRYGEALAVADRSLVLARALGDQEQISSALSLRAKSLLSTAQFELALACCEESCAIARTLGTTTRLSAALNNLGEVHRSLGHVAESERCYEEAIAITRELRYAGGTFVSLCNLTRLSIAAGKHERARVLLLESLTLWASAALKGMGKDLLEGTAGLAAARGENEMAARFGGAARARLDEAGIQREPVDEAFIAPLLARVRASLGGAAYAQAEAAGWALGYTQAMGEVEAWLEGG